MDKNRVIRIDNVLRAHNIIHNLCGNLIPEECIDRTFERLCKRLGRLKDDEQTLFLDLLEKFKVIPLVSYVASFLAILEYSKLLDFCIENDIRTLYVVPLLKEEDFNKLKGSCILSALVEVQGRMSSMFNKDSIDVYYLAPSEYIGCNKNASSHVLFIEDYIGSGKTASEAVKNFEDVCNLSYKDYTIITLASSEIGVETLKKGNEGIRIFSGVLQKRGISGQYNNCIEEKYIAMMHSMTHKLGLKSNKYLGYTHSQALITLNRTPNNTFPVFWDEGKDNTYVFERFYHEE